MQDAQSIKRSKYEKLFHSENKRLENVAFHSLSLHSLIPDGFTSSPGEKTMAILRGEKQAA